MFRFTALIALIATPISAQQRECAPTPTAYEALSSRHGEARVASGVAANGALLEWWANNTTGTWTLLVTTPQGVSCIVADGQGHSAAPAALRPNL